MYSTTGSRSMAGAAAICAAAVLITGPAHPPASARPDRPATLPVALAGIDSPLSELLLSIKVVNNDLFNGTDIFGDYAWQPFQGVVPQFIYTALPIVSQLGYNGARYLGESADALIGAGYILSEAGWNLPGAIITATRQVLAGQFADAVTTLTNATVVPIRTAGTIALDAGRAVLGGVATNIANTLRVVPGILSGLLETASGSAAAVVAAAGTIVKIAVAALSHGDFNAAWNAVVDGLLGPLGSDGLLTSSVAGTSVAVTIGPGLGPQGYPVGYRVPSFRMWTEKSQLTIADAIGAHYPTAAVMPVTRSASAISATLADREGAESGVASTRPTGVGAREGGHRRDDVGRGRQDSVRVADSQKPRNLQAGNQDPVHARPGAPGMHPEQH